MTGPRKRPLEVGATVVAVGRCSDDDNVCEILSEFIEAMPLFPRPVRLATGMKGDRSPRQTKVARRLHGKGSWQRSLPSHGPRELSDARCVAFGVPGPIEEELYLGFDQLTCPRAKHSEAGHGIVLFAQVHYFGRQIGSRPTVVSEKATYFRGTS